MIQNERVAADRSRFLIAACALTACLVMGGETGLSAGRAVASPAAHGDAHAPEIGHNPPAGVSQKDFESPAWFQTDLAVWSFAVFLVLFALQGKTLQASQSAPLPIIALMVSRRAQRLRGEPSAPPRDRRRAP